MHDVLVTKVVKQKQLLGPPSPRSVIQTLFIWRVVGCCKGTIVTGLGKTTSSSEAPVIDSKTSLILQFVHRCTNRYPVTVALLVRQRY